MLGAKEDPAKLTEEIGLARAPALEALGRFRDRYPTPDLKAKSALGLVATAGF